MMERFDKRLDTLVLREIKMKECAGRLQLNYSLPETEESGCRTHNCLVPAEPQQGAFCECTAGTLYGNSPGAHRWLPNVPYLNHKDKWKLFFTYYLERISPQYLRQNFHQNTENSN